MGGGVRGMGGVGARAGDTPGPLRHYWEGLPREIFPILQIKDLKHTEVN